MLAVVVPLALATIFSLTLRDVVGGSVTFDYAVANADRGELGATFEREVLGGLEREGLVDLRRAATPSAARTLVADGKVEAAFVVPAGFSAAVEAGRAASLRVVGNADAQIASQVARSIAESFASDLNGVRLAVATVLALDGSAGSAAELASEALETPSPVSVEDVSSASRELDPKTFYAAGMAVFFLFFTVQFGVSSLLDERREGTLWRLVAAPIRRSSILGGKLLTSFVLGVVSMAVLIVTTSLVLGASWGDPLGVALLVVCGVLSAMGIMALVATLAKTPEQAGNWQAIVALTLGLLGGAFFPVSQVGGVIATLSLLTPHAWFLRGLGDLSGGAGIGSILPALGAILAFAAVTGGIALLRLERMVRP